MPDRHFRHWNLEKVTIEATTNDPSGRREKLILEGSALGRYVGVFWTTAGDREKHQPPEMLLRLYMELIREAETTGDPVKAARLRGTVERITHDWGNTPAVELKTPDCDSEPWPPPYLLQ